MTRLYNNYLDCEGQKFTVMKRWNVNFQLQLLTLICTLLSATLRKLSSAIRRSGYRKVYLCSILNKIIHRLGSFRDRRHSSFDAHDGTDGLTPIQTDGRQPNAVGSAVL